MGFIEVFECSDSVLMHPLVHCSDRENVMHCRLANRFLKLQNITIPHLAVRVITKTLSPCDIGLIGLQPAVPQFLCALPSFRFLLLTFFSQLQSLAIFLGSISFSLTAKYRESIEL